MKIKTKNESRQKSMKTYKKAQIKINKRLPKIEKSKKYQKSIKNTKKSIINKKVQGKNYQKSSF